MSVRLGDIDFDRVSYDAGADVLYLHSGDPETAFDFDGSAEGHALRYDDRDRLVGVTILNARWHLETHGGVVVTTPGERLDLGPDELARALASQAA